MSSVTTNFGGGPGCKNAARGTLLLTAAELEGRKGEIGHPELWLVGVREQ